MLDDVGFGQASTSSRGPANTPDVAANWPTSVWRYKRFNTERALCSPNPCSASSLAATHHSVAQPGVYGGMATGFPATTAHACDAGCWRSANPSCGELYSTGRLRQMATTTRHEAGAPPGPFEFDGPLGKGSGLLVGFQGGESDANAHGALFRETPRVSNRRQRQSHGISPKHRLRSDSPGWGQAKGPLAPDKAILNLLSPRGCLVIPASRFRGCGMDKYPRGVR